MSSHSNAIFDVEWVNLKNECKKHSRQHSPCGQQLFQFLLLGKIFPREKFPRLDRKEMKGSSMADIVSISHLPIKPPRGTCWLILVLNIEKFGLFIPTSPTKYSTSRPYFQVDIHLQWTTTKHNISSIVVSTTQSAPACKPYMLGKHAHCLRQWRCLYVDLPPMLLPSLSELQWLFIWI
jgi:hypothetical protein